MNDGCTYDHKHRYVKVSGNSKWVRRLRKPLWITDVKTAVNSRWTYGAHPHDKGLAVLTPLGILHTLAGIVLVMPAPEEETNERRTG